MSIRSLFTLAIFGTAGWLVWRFLSERRQRAHVEDLLDEALDETFPASDPISVY